MGKAPHYLLVEYSSTIMEILSLYIIVLNAQERYFYSEKRRSTNLEEYIK